MGFDLPAEQLNEVFKRFKGLADRKKVGRGGAGRHVRGWAGLQAPGWAGGRERLMRIDLHLLATSYPARGAAERRATLHVKADTFDRAAWLRPCPAPSAQPPQTRAYAHTHTHAHMIAPEPQPRPVPGPAFPQHISDEDVLALVNEEVHAPPTIITLVDLQVHGGGSRGKKLAGLGGPLQLKSPIANLQARGHVGAAPRCQCRSVLACAGSRAQQHTQDVTPKFGPGTHPPHTSVSAERGNQERWHLSPTARRASSTGQAPLPACSPP